MKKLTILLGLLGLVATGPAWASAISDLFTVYDPTGAIQYQFGVMEDGTPIGGAVCKRVDLQPCAPGLEQNPTINTSGDVYLWYLPVPGLVNSNFTAADYRELVEPSGEPNAGSVSDWIGQFIETQFLGFASDGESGGLPDLFSKLDETGLPVDATMYLSTALQGQGYTATFQSDPIATPEPGTFTLLAVGLAAAGLRRKGAKRPV